MSENSNVRLGLIELYKNKVRFLGLTDAEMQDMKVNSYQMKSMKY